MQRENAKVISITEAGTQLGLNRTAAYLAAARGDIPTIRIGRRILVPRHAIDELIERAMQKPGNAV
jgi:excisionase family DNA binding protein